MFQQRKHCVCALPCDTSCDLVAISSGISFGRFYRALSRRGNEKFIFRCFWSKLFIYLKRYGQWYSFVHRIVRLIKLQVLNGFDVC